MSRFVSRFAAGFIAVAGTILIAGGVSAAADYPARPVTLVVPYPPGGGVDAMARVVAAKLSDALHQQFIVDNRAGAGGTIGTRAVAQAAPDGYTLLLGHTGTISINPTLYTHAGYDPRKDFAPIGLVGIDAGGLARASVFPGKIDRRIHRDGQERPRQAQSRHLGGWHRRLYVRRAVQVRSRHRCRASFPTRAPRR